MKNLINSLLILVCAAFIGACSNNSNSRSTDGESVTAAAHTDSERALAPDSAALVASRIPAKKGMPQVLEFSATWCGPCQAMKPVFEEAVKKYDGKIKMQSIDVDENPALTEKYNIHSIPAFILIDAYGKVVERHEGLMQADELDSMLNSLLNR